VGPLTTRGGWVAWLLWIAPLLWLISGSAVSAATGNELATWAAGPVQWLLLPEERKELKHVAKAAETVAFIDSFWQRRDPFPDEGGNAYREEYMHRVEAADILYSDEGTRGGLTDRGRALILLGPPSHVTVSQQPVMAWDSASDSSDRVTMRDVAVEIWGYKMEELPVGMLQIWMAKKKKAAEGALTLTLMFRKVGRRTSLVEGEPLLEAAARAAVLQSDD
jgi:GWxTD domain-containing protein